MRMIIEALRPKMTAREETSIKMSERIAPVRCKASTAARSGTTLFAVGWGLLASYQLLQGLLVTHSLRFMVVGPLALLMVWATLERKRWGRLALLGMSGTVVIVCLVGDRLADASGAVGLHTTLHFFAAVPGGLVALLLLAAWTIFWMHRSIIVAEFEQGKRSGLQTGQRAIAAALVGFWAALLILPSPASTRRAYRKQGAQTQHTALPYRLGAPPASSSRIARSAASHSSR